MKIFRLLPITIIAAVFLLCIKVSDLLTGTQSLLIASVAAQQPEKPSNVSTEKPKDVAQSESAAKADAKKEETKSTDKKSDEKPDKAAEKKDEKSEEKPAEKKEEKKDPENPNVSTDAGSTTDHRFTSVEVELLQSLAKRRSELDRWEKNIQIKEAALDATQKRISDKAQQIEAMKKEVATLLAQYNSQEDAKIRSLVKIYENMKPADAARIFDEVEMPILLLVIDTMSEKKAAPILAAMNPKKAKQLTVELANERKVGTRKTNGAVALTAPPALPPSLDAVAPAPAVPTSAPAPTPNPAAPAPAPAPTPTPAQ